MITATQCKKFADHYRSLSSHSNISESRAFLLRNIAKTFAGLAGQLDRLDALARDEEKAK